MVEYDQKEQARLENEFKDSVREAFKKYVEYVEGVFSYGCDSEVLKKEFVSEVKKYVDESMNGKGEVKP